MLQCVVTNLANASAGPPGVSRTTGFLAACLEHGVAIPRDRVLLSRFDVAGGRVATERLLDGPERPTAVFVVNDFAAVGAMGAEAVTMLIQRLGGGSATPVRMAPQLVVCASSGPGRSGD